MSHEYNTWLQRYKVRVSLEQKVVADEIIFKKMGGGG